VGASATAALGQLQNEVVRCTLCPRLVEYRQRVAREKKRMYHDHEYWGRPLPSFGDANAARVGGGAGARLPTAATAQAACSPGTAAATGSTRPCTAAASPAVPGLSNATTASPYKTCTSRRPSDATPLVTGPAPEVGQLPPLPCPWATARGAGGTERWASRIGTGTGARLSGIHRKLA